MDTPLFVTAVLGRLREWFAVVEATGDLLALEDPRFGRHTYRLEAQRSVTRALAGTLHPRSSLPTLLVAPYISDPVADVLRARGIDYVDAVGNARLASDSSLIDVRGRRAATSPQPRTEHRAARAFTRSGAQVLFALLSWPELTSKPLRAIAAAAGVSHGSAQIVMDELLAAHYVFVSAGERQLARGRELLDRWTEAYAVSLFPKLEMNRFSAREPDWWHDSLEDLHAGGVQLGGESAAEMIDPHLRPATVTLYAETQPFAVLARHPLRRDENGEVELRRRFWKTPEGEEDEALVPIPLIYADLLASGEPRQREHAQRLRGTNARLQRIDQL